MKKLLLTSVLSLSMTMNSFAQTGDLSQGTVTATGDFTPHQLKDWMAQNTTSIFGDGSDGSISIYGFRDITLTRDMYYENVTIKGFVHILTNGFRIFVKGTLDISAAGEYAIVGNYVGAGGENATSSIGAPGVPIGRVFGAIASSSTIPQAPYTASNGGTGNATTGINPTQTNSIVGVGISGPGGAGGSGGAGMAGTYPGGSGLPGQTIAIPYSLGSTFPSFYNSYNPVGLFPVAIGAYGGPGGQGGGDGVNSGGGGGGAAPGGVGVYIAAQYIQRGTNTMQNIIASTGGVGGSGYDSFNTYNNTGDGGGGGGGSGGLIYIITGHLLGSTIINALNASGGSGGNGLRTGSNGSSGSSGGAGGGSGAIVVIDLENSTKTILQPFSAGSPGSAPTASSIGIGGAGAIVQANL